MVDKIDGASANIHRLLLVVALCMELCNTKNPFESDSLQLIVNSEEVRDLFETLLHIITVGLIDNLSDMNFAHFL